MQPPSGRLKFFVIGGLVIGGALVALFVSRGATFKNISTLLKDTFTPERGEIVESFNVSDRRSPFQKESGSELTASLVDSVHETNEDTPTCKKQSAPTYSILINEVAWAGTDAKNTTHEWIELFNPGSRAVSLRNWQLVNSDESIKIVFGSSAVLGAGSYYVLERKDDDTVPGTRADGIFSGTIRNANESLMVFDGSCSLIDEAIGIPEWAAGEASPTYRTLERAANMSWQTYTGSGSNGIFGTPKTKNSTPPVSQAPQQEVVTNQPQQAQASQESTVQEIPPSQQESVSPPPAPEPEQENISSPPPPPTGSARIVISEIMVGGEGNAANEFIELYNAGSAAADLTGWSIKKKTSTGSEGSLVTATRLEGKTIGSGKYFLIVNDGGYTGSVVADATWAKSNTLAYTSNSIVLYDVSGTIVEEISWIEIPKDQSFGRISFDVSAFQVSAIPTPQNSQ